MVIISSIERYIMVACVELEVRVHPILTLEPGGGDWLASHFDRLVVARVSHSTGGSVEYSIKCKWDNQAKKTERKEGGGIECGYMWVWKALFHLSEGH